MEQISIENFSEKKLPEIGKLGKAPAKTSMKALILSDYLPKAAPLLPKATNFWTKKKPIPLRAFGNMQYGCCTRASQANAALRMERLEQKRTIDIADDEVIRVYKEATTRRFGADWINDPIGADTGDFESDSLSDWRKPDLTFRDTKNRPLTIDAFVKINHNNIDEIKQALVASKGQGIKICLNMPLAWQRTLTWDIPEGQQPIGEFLRGSWGGHSLYSEDYNEFGLIMPTWDTKVTVSWKAILYFCDESYLIIDSINSWKKKVDKKQLNISAIKSDVNSVSSQKIK